MFYVLYTSVCIPTVYTYIYTLYMYIQYIYIIYSKHLCVQHPAKKLNIEYSLKYIHILPWTLSSFPFIHAEKSLICGWVFRIFP